MGHCNANLHTVGEDASHKLLRRDYRPRFRSTLRYLSPRVLAEFHAERHDIIAFLSFHIRIDSLLRIYLCRLFRKRRARNFLLSIFTRDKLRSALRERHAAERKIPLGGRRRGEEDRERTRDEKREANPLGAGSSSAAAATSSSSFSFSPLRRRATKPQEGPKVSRDNDRSLKYAPRQFADQNYY